jgi:hypothetical protein
LKNLKVVQNFMRNSLLFEEAVKFWILCLIFDKNAWDLGKSVISCGDQQIYHSDGFQTHR